MDGADCCGAGCRNKLVPSLAPSRSSSLSTSSIASKICLLVDSHKSRTCLFFTKSAFCDGTTSKPPFEELHL